VANLQGQNVAFKTAMESSQRSLLDQDRVNDRFFSLSFLFSFSLILQKRVVSKKKSMQPFN
jgi:hypothetical protein